MLSETFLTAFATMLVAIGPFENVPIFLGLTPGMILPRAAGSHSSRRPRRSLCCWPSSSSAFGCSSSWAWACRHSVRPAALLLLMVSADLLLVRQSGISSITPNEKREAGQSLGVAVVPLAIPLIAGPGSMTAVVLLMTKAKTSLDAMSVALGLAAVMTITLASMLAGNRIMKVLGVTGSNAVARASGILLAALAMQFVFDGLATSGLFRPAPR
jgi:multiple antibiotic resistance protein